MMQPSKWFIRSEEIIDLTKDICLLKISSIQNDEYTVQTIDFESNENENYWKYRSFEELIEKILLRYRIARDTIVIVYTREKLMVAARFAWLLHWIGCEYVRILIGQLIPTFINTDRPSIIPKVSWPPRAPLRPDARLTCTELCRQLPSETTQFIDVRTSNEYLGKTTGYSYVRQSGHIPGFEYDFLDGLFGRIDGNISPTTKRLVYMCGTGWRASLAAICAQELDLAKMITVLDSGWFE